jgi:folate-binding protein YgfZ
MSEGYEALRHGAAWLDLETRGRIAARGRDRARLLHAITSNEVRKMVPGDSCYAFLLNPQGRIQADLYLLCLADHFLIDTEPGLREKVHQHIRRYIIADQVELADVGEQTACLGVEGPAAASLQLAPGEQTVAPFTVTGQPGYRIYCPAESKAALVRQLESLGAKPAGADDVRLVRIENGKPLYGEDIRDTTLPQETQQMQAVSFNKGCYLGQEIVERIRAQGRVNKKLERLELEGAEPPAPGARLTVDGRDAEVTSAVYSPHFGKTIALAYVRVA